MEKKNKKVWMKLEVDTGKVSMRFWIKGILEIKGKNKDRLKLVADQMYSC